MFGAGIVPLDTGSGSGSSELASTISRGQTFSGLNMGIQGAGQITTSIFGMLTAGIQLAMQKDALTHKSNMAKGNFEMEKARLNANDKLVDDVGKLQEPAQVAAQDKAKAEGELAEVKERLHQQELSKNASRRTNQQVLNRLMYRYGEPVRPV